MWRRIGRRATLPYSAARSLSSIVGIDTTSQRRECTAVISTLRLRPLFGVSRFALPRASFTSGTPVALGGQDGRSKDAKASTSKADAKDSSGTSDRGKQIVDDDGVHEREKAQALTKPKVPDVYPRLLAIPLSRRALFPGFHKAIAIADQHLIGAIQELIRLGQPYVATFVLKDDAVDTDLITSPDQIHSVGTFAQITDARLDEGGKLLAVLYPYRRIQATSLTPSPIMKKEDASPAAEASTTPTPTDAVVDTTPPATLLDMPFLDTDELATTTAAEEEETAEDGKDKTEPQRIDPSVDHFLPRDAFPVARVTVRNLYDAYTPAATQMEPNTSSSSTSSSSSSLPGERQSDAISQKEAHRVPSSLTRALTSEIVATIRDLARHNPAFREHITYFSLALSSGNVFEEPGKLADFAAALCTGTTGAEQQSILQALEIDKRLELALEMLRKELETTRIEAQIQRDILDSAEKTKKDFYRMEQMKSIQRELGVETDGKEKMIEKFKKAAAEAALPAQAKAVFDEELEKFRLLDQASPDFNLSRGYLDWLVSLPWSKTSDDVFDLGRAETILQEDHYGLQKVKERILEFIAIGAIKKSVQGKIICLTGPPGVGKTSVAKSIARALNREFFRFSVGGLNDVSEIKGTRRTYIGAMPGKFIQALKKVQVKNPLILLDEIDKVGRGSMRGDPTSALLEVLDPAQNATFMDHYLDVPVDLSKVLFVCTSNVMENIPAPLLDRMEVISLSGYLAEEKLAIAQQYLEKAAFADTGLRPDQVEVRADVYMELIKWYCRESGVRSLKQMIEKIFRKAVFKIVEREQHQSPLTSSESSSPSSSASQTKKDNPKVLVSPDNLADYVGHPLYTTDKVYGTTMPPGVVMGLAWSSMGGAALYIECISTSVPSSGLASQGDNKEAAQTRQGSFKQTGQLGKVMQESTSIALAYAKQYVASHFSRTAYDALHQGALHLHVPEGATPKDGPSAGITMCLALVSLATQQSVRPHVAMTGELTLTGRVLKIGGVREKVVAARRVDVQTILLPEENRHDWEELEAYLKAGLQPIFVRTFEEVATAALRTACSNTT